MVAECVITDCVGKIAPLYNIALVFITFYLLYRLVSLRSRNKDVFFEPWYYLFAAISFFLLESIITALKFFNVISDALIPRWFNAVFELFIIVLVIYMLFVQLNHVKDNYENSTLKKKRGSSSVKSVRSKSKKSSKKKPRK